MIKRIQIILLVFLCSFLNFTFAQTSAQQLEDLLNHWQSLQTRFKQTIMNERGRVVQNSEGQFMLKRPNQFRWETETPQSQLIVSDGKTLWIYDRDLDQVIKKPLIKTLKNTPALWLAGDTSSMTRDYIISNKSKNAKQNNFLLKSKSHNVNFSYILLKFDNQQLRSMELKDQLGQTTRLNFYQIKFNQTLSANHFKFVPPSNADVIEQ